jgi:hypothetical protein
VSGLVSSAIEKEVLGELRRQGIVVWLDKDASYTRFVDDLAARHARGEFPFPVVGFRGSFLELLFQLEPFGSGLDRQPLLIHMPGFNEESIRKTPVLELYEPGVRFRKGLDTLIREAATARVAPAEVEKFVAKQPSLEEADAWLTSAVSQSTFGLAAALDEFGPKMLAEALAQPSSSLTLRVTAPEEVQALRSYVHKLTGMDDAWIEFFGEDRNLNALDNVLAALAAWILCVEYVHDLKRPARLKPLQHLRDLSPPVAKACCDLAARVRRDNGDAYVRIADEVEAFLAEELRDMSPEDLGRIDPFREEENRVLTGAVEALGKGDWSKARAWCEVRQGDKSFWLQRDQIRRWAWSLVAEAAEFGETLARHPRPFEGARSLEQAAERYAAGTFEVDRAHRRFEQISRLRQAVAEIKKVAKSDPIRAAGGAVLLFERLSSALECVDSSSGAISSAVIRAIEELEPRVRRASRAVRLRSAEGLWGQRGGRTCSTGGSAVIQRLISMSACRLRVAGDSGARSRRGGGRAVKTALRRAGAG